MRNLSSTILTVFLLVFTILAISTGTANAYLDPGSGSLLIQVLIGGVFAGLLSLKLFWARVIGLVRGLGFRRTKDD